MSNAFFNRGGYAGTRHAARDYKLLFSFLPVILMSVLLRGPATLVVWALSGMFSVLLDFLLSVLDRRQYCFSPYSLLLGFFIAAYLPDGVSLYHLFVAIGFAHVVVLWPFGGRGYAWLNPVAAGVVFIMLAVPSLLSSFSATLYSQSDTLPFFLIKQSAASTPVMASVSFSASSFDSAISSYLNDSILSSFAAYIPSGYVDLFLGNVPGPLAAISTAPVILIGAYLLWDYVVDAVSVISFLAVYACFVWFFGSFADTGVFAQGDVLFYLFSTDVFFAAFFLLSDPISTPFSMLLSRLWSAFLGLLAALFSVMGFSPFPALLAIGVGCVFVPLTNYIKTRFVLLQGAKDEEN
ncbi:RnfABCDGE type electron transport complex subunit D [Spirochaetia bacterium 38H-sp]|uniref:RnfABCDGE type electron transport complex subunit D n=1 Tax=Rarispira pelagica TaxID=3141764 RepID=A0ABU9UAX9_9SPIR